MEHHSAWYWVHTLADRWTGPERPPSPAPSWFTLQLSTAAAERDPYDFWRHRVYYDFSAERRADPLHPFVAEAQAVVSPRGEFVHSRSSDIAGARTRAGINRLPNANLTLGIMLKGRRDFESGDWRHRAEAGGLYLYDAANPSRVQMTAHRTAYLSLKADIVDAVLGAGRPDHAVLLQRLERAPLLPFFHMQLLALVETPRRRNAVDAGTLLDIAIDLALLMLRQTPTLPEGDVGELRRGLVVAAQQLMARHLGEARLDADFVAAELGCSRATLYRAFADCGLTVAGHIRTMRLIHARHLIERSSFAERIGDLILDCGLDDTIHFSRQFRHLFGIRPSEVKGIRFGVEPEQI